jgi:peptide/nickel transport system permease protein
VGAVTVPTELSPHDPITASARRRARPGHPGAAVLRVLRQRLLQAVAVAGVVSTACFVIVQTLPGDIGYRIAAGRYGYDQVDAASAAAVREELGLDRPGWQQMLTWWSDLARLDLGSSLVTGGSVATELAHHLVGSIQLAAAALALAFVAGVVIGTLAALRAGGVLDRFAGLWVTGTRGLPPFLLGLLLILVFSVHLGVLPAAGDGARTSIVLPALTLAAGLSGLFARVTRDAVTQVLESEHVRFAETKGLSARLVFLRHVARNTGVTLVAYLGVQALVLIEGVVVVESLFAWPGLGHALVHAVFWRDVPSLQATALALALLVVAINTLVDLASLALDPRPRGGQVVA